MFLALAFRAEDSDALRIAPIHDKTVDKVYENPIEDYAEVARDLDYDEMMVGRIDRVGFQSLYRARVEPPPPLANVEWSIDLLFHTVHSPSTPKYTTDYLNKFLGGIVSKVLEVGHERDDVPYSFRSDDDSKALLESLFNPQN